MLMEGFRWGAFCTGTAGKGTSCWELHWVVSVQGLPIYKELTQDPSVLLIYYETDSDYFIFLSLA